MQSLKLGDGAAPCDHRVQHYRLRIGPRHRVATGTAEPPDPWDSIAGTYPCGDGRVVRLHTNFPHHRAGVLRLLRCVRALVLNEMGGNPFR